MQLAAHGRAQNHAGALSVQRAIGIAVVGQGFGGNGYSPLLPFIHGGRNPGRNAKAFPIELKIPNPTADLAVAFERRTRIGVVIIGDIPALGRHFRNAVALGDNVLPESRRIGCIR